MNHLIHRDRDPNPWIHLLQLPVRPRISGKRLDNPVRQGFETVGFDDLQYPHIEPASSAVGTRHHSKSGIQPRAIAASLDRQPIPRCPVSARVGFGFA